MPLADSHLFLLGFAAGITVLAMTAYAVVTPRWLRWLLMGSGLLLIIRPGTAVGVTLPVVVALDQLVRHPAMTPKKLLRWYAPFAVLSLVSPIVAIVQLVFAGLVAWLSFQLVPKLPDRRIKQAIVFLCAATIGWAISWWWPIWLLRTQIVVLVAVWFALDTARHASS